MVTFMHELESSKPKKILAKVKDLIVLLTEAFLFSLVITSAVALPALIFVLCTH
jgi:hypothetical protein